MLESAGAGFLGFTDTTAFTSEKGSASGSVDLSAYRQDLAFFTALSTERFVIDVRAGDDEVHADPEYLIQGSEWGIKAGNLQERALLANLVIRGGAGADRLFGGFGDDTIEGGEGADVIAGGPGNDRIDGGSGDDWISGGGATLIPDAYEIVRGMRNDTDAFAAVIRESLTSLLSGTAIKGLNFSLNDQADWYALRTPPALQAFDSATAAQFVSSMVKVKFTGESDTEVAPMDRTKLASFIRTKIDAGQIVSIHAGREVGSRIEAVDRFEGVPDYYLIRVRNPLLAFAADLAADTDAALVNMQHDLGRRLTALAEKPLQDMHDEFHRRVVVVEQKHLVHGRRLEFFRTLFQERAAIGIKFCCHAVIL